MVARPFPLMDVDPIFSGFASAFIFAFPCRIELIEQV